MGGFDEVSEQLVRAMDAVSRCDPALAALVVAADRPINHRYLDIHHEAITLLASQAPVAGDLRLVAALLHIVWCLERMGDQCVNVAKLVPLSGYESPSDEEMLAAIEDMGRLVGLQIVQARETFVSRNIELAEDLAFQDTKVDQLNRQVFRRAVDIGDDVELREWAMFMVLIARALERIGDNTVDVAEQTVFLVTGELRELVDLRSSPGEGPEPDPDDGRARSYAPPRRRLASAEPSGHVRLGPGIARVGEHGGRLVELDEDADPVVLLVLPLGHREEAGAIADACGLLHVVRHDDDRVLDTSSSMSSSIRRVETGSSAEHGSSMRMTSGSTAMHRAMHRRCCWPPRAPWRRP